MPQRAARLSPESGPPTLLLGLVLLAVGVMAEADIGFGTQGAVGDLAAGLALFGAGLTMWASRPGSWSGPLALLAGLTWFAGDAAGGLVYLHRGPLVQLLLTYPTGRTRSPVTIAVIAAAYVDGLVPALARADWPTIALSMAVVAVAAARYVRTTGLERRAAAAPLAATLATAGALALAAVLRLTGVEARVGMLWILDIVVVFAAGVLALDLRFGRWARAAATGLVVDLGHHRELQAVRGALARALGDPSLQIAYRWSDRDAWVDEAGRVVELPVATAGRARTLVEHDGAPVAALVHEAGALREDDLTRAVEAGVRLAVVNARLQAGMAARVRDGGPSRRRLVEAAAAERRRFGALLRSGPERRLEEAGARLERLAVDHAAARELCATLAGCRDDVHRFGQGLHPQALSDSGLRAALEEVVRRAGGPVTLDAPARRFAPAQEEAMFFFCSEALANVAKYAPGAATRVVVHEEGTRLVATVTDDGPGGASIDGGSGLRGLADRLEALGGRLRVSSPRDTGTVLEAELPLGGAA